MYKFKKDDWVILDKGAFKDSPDLLLRYIEHNRVPVKLNMTSTYGDSASINLINYFPSLNQSWNYTIYSGQASYITEAEAKELLKNYNDINNLLKARREYLISLIKNAKAVGYQNMNLKTDLSDLSTADSNYLDMGEWNGDNFIVHSTGVGIGCCARTIDGSNDIQVYIPKLYLDYIGYTENDLKTWLEFIKSLDIGFIYTIEDSELPDSYMNIILREKEDSKKLFPVEDDYILPISPINGQEDLSKDSKYSSTFLKLYSNQPVYKVRIKHSTDKFLTYMRFLILRYMYNTYYWEIPATTLRIKEALGDKVSNWEALLMAHLRRHHYTTYCLVANVNLGEGRGDRYHNPFITVKQVLNNIKTDRLNNCFEYLDNILEKDSIDTYFDKEDWEGLYNYLKSKIK